MLKVIINRLIGRVAENGIAHANNGAPLSIKQSVIKLVSISAGIVLGLAIIAGVGVWISQRPASWNSRAINAKFEAINVNSSNRNIQFFYTLTNNTTEDYSLTIDDKVEIMSKIEDNVLKHHEQDIVRLAEDIYVPAKRSARISIEIALEYDKLKPEKGSIEDRKKWRRDLESYFKNLYPMLRGFVVFDKRTKYEIDLPLQYKSTGAD